MRKPGTQEHRPGTNETTAPLSSLAGVPSALQAWGNSAGSTTSRARGHFPLPVLVGLASVVLAGTARLISAPISRDLWGLRLITDSPGEHACAQSHFLLANLKHKPRN